MRFNALIIISISCGLLFVSNDLMAQYRDPFSEKSKRSTIKKRNKKGLTSSMKTNSKKQIPKKQSQKNIAAES